MAKKQVTVSLYVKEELKDKFEQVFQESEFNSKGEFFGVLLDNYLIPDEKPDNRGPDQTITELQIKIEDLEKKNKKLWQEIENPAKANDDPIDAGNITLPTTNKQAELIKKCYDDKDGFEKEIIKDLVKMAMSWIKIRQGGLFSDDEYSRLFLLKGIITEEFEAAFLDYIQEDEGEKKHCQP
jgi:hypothetical protein